jgi:hypothetical protein
MKTLLNRRDRIEVLSPLANVRPDNQAKWGTMSARQMICHLSDSFRAALGAKYISPSTSLFKRAILKPLALWVPVPWPHGFNTRPEMDQQQGGTTPVEFSSDIEKLRTLFERFCIWTASSLLTRCLGRCRRSNERVMPITTLTIT